MTSPAGRRFFNHPPAALGLFTLVFFVTVALAAPWVAPYDPSLQLEIVDLKNQPPSLLHPLGTDLYSRDVWSRLAYGARVSLSIAALAMLVAVTLGALVGAVAGYMRRWVDTVLMRTVDVGLAIPRIFLLLMAIALWERLPLGLLVLVIGVTGWFGTSRLVRAEVLTLRERDFVTAARALGAGPVADHRRTYAERRRADHRFASLGIGNVICSRQTSFLGIRLPASARVGNISPTALPSSRPPWTPFSGAHIALVGWRCRRGRRAALTRSTPPQRLNSVRRGRHSWSRVNSRSDLL